MTNNNQQPNDDEAKEIKRQINEIYEPLVKFCRAGIRKAAEINPRDDWWYAQKVHWCARLVELHRKLDQDKEHRLAQYRYNDLRYLIATNETALAELKRLDKHVELVKEVQEMLDLHAQPLAVQIARIQQFVKECDSDEKLAAAIPCSVQTVVAWKSGQVARPVTGYRKKLCALVSIAAVNWQRANDLRLAEKITPAICPFHPAQNGEIPPSIH